MEVGRPAARRLREKWEEIATYSRQAWMDGGLCGWRTSFTTLSDGTSGKIPAVSKRLVNDFEGSPDQHASYLPSPTLIWKILIRLDRRGSFVDREKVILRQFTIEPNSQINEERNLLYYFYRSRQIEEKPSSRTYQAHWLENFTIFICRLCGIWWNRVPCGLTLRAANWITGCKDGSSLSRPHTKACYRSLLLDSQIIFIGLKSAFISKIHIRNT